MSSVKRLDQLLVTRKLADTRSHAAKLISLGLVKVNGGIVTKPGKTFPTDSKLTLKQKDNYVSRAAYKLESVAEKLELNFNDKVVLDVGSSTGGFSDYALKHGASKVIAVDVGTDQLHPKIRQDKRVEVHEKTDIREFKVNQKVDMVLMDLSFISLREILPYVANNLVSKETIVVAMVKPQFEAGEKLKNRGVIKNNTVRREILRDFEAWVKKLYVILDKADSEVTGSKGNQERFYLLKII